MAILLAGVLALVSCLMIACFAEGAGALSLADLRGARAHVAGKLAVLLTGEDGKPRAEFTEEELAESQKLQAEFDDLEAKIKTEEGKREKVEANVQLLARVKAAGQPVPSTLGATNDGVEKTVVGGVRENVTDDPTGGYKSMGEFACAAHDVFHPAVSAKPDERLNVLAAMSQGIQSDGGILTPPAYSRTLWDEAQKRADNLTQYCANWNVPDGAESITVPAIAETSRADGSRWGGITGAWKSELAQLSTSAPTLRQLKLEPHELYVFVDATNKLLRNAPQVVGQLINVCAPDEINFKVNDAIVNGTGGDQPRGIMQAASKIEVSAEAEQVAATIVTENIFNMHLQLWAMYRAGAIWLINQDCEAQLDQMFFAVGTGGVPTYLPAGGITANSPGMLKGKPVIPVEYCQTLGTTGDIILANLRAYALAMKGTVERAVSMHLYFDYARTAFRFMFEVDGAPIMNSAITAAKGSTEYSAIITLATRS